MNAPNIWVLCNFLSLVLTVYPFTFMVLNVARREGCWACGAQTTTLNNDEKGKVRPKGAVSSRSLPFLFSFLGAIAWIWQTGKIVVFQACYIVS